MGESPSTAGEPDSSVEVVPYRPEWPVLFEAERSALAEAVGLVARSIEHIGSTAVPGLSSKPTIDILMVVDSPEAFFGRLGEVAALGYDHREGAFVNGEDHLFLRKVLDGKRICHLHVLRTGSPEVTDYRLFRDALRDDEDLALRYERLKMDLATRYANQRMRYVAEKEAWVTGVLESLRGSL